MCEVGQTLPLAGASCSVKVGWERSVDLLLCKLLLPKLKDFVNQQVPIQWIWRGAQESALLASFQGMTLGCWPLRHTWSSKVSYRLLPWRSLRKY